MSTVTIDNPQITMIPTLKIIQVPGTNPRGEFSHSSPEFVQLKASVARRGIETPIKVGAATVESGDELLYPVIYGFRRHAAAIEAGLAEVPAIIDETLVTEKDRFEAAVAENMDRAEMGPVAEARSLARLRKLGATQEEAAETMGMSVRSARDRQKLLDVPPAIAEMIAGDDIPLEAIPHLAKVAGVSKDLAIAVVELVRSGKALHGLRLDQLGHLDVVADALGQIARKHGLQPIHGPHEEGTKPGGLPVSAEQKKELAALHRELPEPPHHLKPGFKFGPADKKKAKEKRCLFELTYSPSWGGKKTDAYITDPDLVYELAKAKAPVMKREIEAERKAAEESKKANGTAQPIRPAAANPQAEADRQKQIEKEEKKRQREARMWEKSNRELGEALELMPNPKATDVDVVRLVVAAALGHEEWIGEYLLDGLGAISERYRMPEIPEEGRIHPEALLLADLANAKTSGECLKIYLQYAFGAQYVQPEGCNLEMPGPHRPGFNVDAMLDDLAERLEILPKPVAKIVADRQATRAERLAEIKAAEARREEEAAAAAAEPAISDQAAQVLKLIKAEPGVAASKLAAETGIKPNALYRLVGDLEQADLITKKGRHYTAVDQGAEG